MRCEKCENKIKLREFLLEAANPLKRSYHICSNCGRRYKVNVYLGAQLIIVVGLLKAYKYWLMNTMYVYLTFKQAIYDSIIPLLLIYLICFIEHIVYYIRKSIKQR